MNSWYLRVYARFGCSTQSESATVLKLMKIAYSMGYETDANIARLFQKSRGMTPHAFRRKNGKQVGLGEQWPYASTADFK